MSGLAALVAMLFLLEPMWPRARDIFGASVATGAMLAVGAPLRGLAPGVLAMTAQIGAGVVVYGALAYAFDVADIRAIVGARLRRRR
jgi:hypothetical protein